MSGTKLYFMLWTLNIFYDSQFSFLERSNCIQIIFHVTNDYYFIWFIFLYNGDNAILNTHYAIQIAMSSVEY